MSQNISYILTKSGPTGRFAPDFGDIRKLMFTKFCDISSHNLTWAILT